MQSITYSVILAVALSTFGCGSANNSDDAKNPADKSGTTPNGQAQEQASEVEAAGDTVAMQVDEAIAAAVEEQESGAQQGALYLLGGAKNHKIQRYRQCSEDGDVAKVEIKRSSERQITAKGPQREGSMESSNIMALTRTFSREGGEVNCDEQQKRVDLAREDMEGIKLEATFTKERSRVSNLSNPKKGTTLSRSMKHKSSGTRTILWTDVQKDQNTITLTKTVTQSATMTMEFTNKDGVMRSLERTLATAAEAPLVVVTVRDAVSDAVESRTIVSGKKLATGKNGERIETSFDNVRYEPGKGCYAVSGTIAGAMFAPGSSEATTTFRVSFSGDTKTINFADGKEVEYVADGCDLDDEDTSDGAAEVEEKSASTDVKLAE